MYDIWFENEVLKGNFLRSVEIVIIKIDNKVPESQKYFTTDPEVKFPAR